jgi:hypothetical protein
MMTNLPRSHGGRLPVGRALVGLTLALALAAGCTTPGSATPGPTATPPQPTSVPTDAASLPAFVCGQPVTRAGSVPTARMSGFAAANASGVGRIEFTFRPEGNVAAVPQVTVKPVDPPFTMDPSGLPLSVIGTAFLQVVLQGGTALDANMESTFAGPFDAAPNGSPIVEVKRAGDFEAVSTFIVGLDGPACIRILPPDGSSHLVIEIQAGP